MDKNKLDTHDNRLRLDDAFNFGCNDKLECFTKCCMAANIWLTPYDVIRMKKGLGISSGKFLKLYTTTCRTKDIGYPIISMKLKTDKAKGCPFRTSKGCKVYDDRPWVCRMYPLVPVPVDKRASAFVDWPNSEFELNVWGRCMGFSGGKPVTIRQWRDSQSLVEYEAVNRAWKKVTHHDGSGSKNLLRGKAAEQFHLGCYNMDDFRLFVFDGDFLGKFDLSKAILKKIKSDDTALLMFAFLWLRHVLFGESTLKRR